MKTKNKHKYTITDLIKTKKNKIKNSLIEKI